MLSALWVRPIFQALVQFHFVRVSLLSLKDGVSLLSLKDGVSLLSLKDDIRIRVEPEVQPRNSIWS